MANGQVLARAAQPGYDPYAGHSDTGWFGSSLVKSVSKAASSVGKAVASGVNSAGGAVVKVASAPVKLASKAGIAGKIGSALLTPGIYLGQQGARSLQSTANNVVNTVRHPNWKNLAATAQQALKNGGGPLGMVGAGAIAAMAAGLQGKNIEGIAWAAAEGATPEGISHAISVAEKIRHGGSIIDAALKEAQSSFLPGTAEMLGFNSAIAALKNQASLSGLGEVRRALQSEGSRRAFDAAIGTVSKAVKTGALTQRAAGIVNISLSRPKAVLSVLQPNLDAAIKSLTRNPGLMSVDPLVLANRLSTNQATIRDAIARVSQKSVLPWRSMSPRAVSFIRRFNPHAPITALRHAHTDTAGLDQTGMRYIVEKGDGPWAIAQKLTGNGNRWVELKDVNKDKKPTVDKNVWVGEVLNLPLSWQKPVAASAPPKVALPSVPLPTIAPIPTPSNPSVLPTVSILPSVIQAKSILVAWAKTDGINQAGVSDYGGNIADLSTTMGPRDTLELASFQVWDNKTLNGGLPTTGALDAKTLAALQAWAEARATAAIPGGVTSNGNPATPVVLPVDVPEVISAGTIGGTAPPAATPSVQPANGGSSMGPVALGAVIGGLLFGVPGALAGAAGGAAIS